MSSCRSYFQNARKRPFFCCERVRSCYKPAATITLVVRTGFIQTTKVIDSINLEHDWPPENRFTLFGNQARASRPGLMLSAGVAELVDALDLGSSDESCGGSSPSARTKRRSRLRKNDWRIDFLGG
jgi:hypothetical protein